MTYFENGGKHYVIWAEIKGDSSLFMAEINPDEPWKLISKPILLTKPEYSWELVNHRVNEGAAVLKTGGRVYVFFSASGTGSEYCVGRMWADENADLMNAASWHKEKNAVLSTADLDGESGPGHNSFVTDEMIDGMAQGEKWIAMMYSGDAAYASMENEKLAVWAPEQGTNIAIDCMFIPSNATNPELANQFINYVLDYDNSMMITVETCYTSPNAKVLEDVTAPGGEFDGVEGYLPRSGYEKDEIYQYVKLLQAETPELLLKVKMQ